MVETMAVPPDIGYGTNISVERLPTISETLDSDILRVCLANISRDDLMRELYRKWLGLYQ